MGIKVEDLTITTTGTLGDFLIKDKAAGGTGGTEKISISDFISTYGLSGISGLTTNYIPVATSATTIGDSFLSQDASNVFIANGKPLSSINGRVTVNLGSGVYGALGFDDGVNSGGFSVRSSLAAITHTTEIILDAPQYEFSSLTPSRVAGLDAASHLVGLDTATYPSLVELAYVKGVTSGIQTQINGKEPSISAGTTAQYWRGDKSWQSFNGDVDSRIQAYTGDVTLVGTAFGIGVGKVTNAMLAGSIDYSKLASMTSAQLYGIVSDPTGIGGGLVFSDSPSFVTPFLHSATAKSISITGTAGTGFMSYITQASQPSVGASGFVMYANASGRLAWRRQSDTFERSFAGTLTADRVYTLPDASGTMALSTDLGASTFCIQLGIVQLSPAASTTYYFGSGQLNVLRTTAGISRIYYRGPNTTLNKADVFVNATGGGSATTSSIYFRLNNTTDYLITSALATNAASNFSAAAIGMPLVDGDYFEVKWPTPAWPTPPTNLILSVMYRV